MTTAAGRVTVVPMTTTSAPDDTSTHVPRDLRPARWAWWGVAAAALGLAGNLIASHSALTDADAAVAVADTSRTTQHAGTLLGMASFVCLVLVAAGWRRWAGDAAGLAAQAWRPRSQPPRRSCCSAPALRGALAEYLPGGINDDNFTDDGLYVLFMAHDTAPWFAGGAC